MTPEVSLSILKSFPRVIATIKVIWCLKFKSIYMGIVKYPIMLATFIVSGEVEY